MPPQEWEIILVRHGQTEFNVQQRLQVGWAAVRPASCALGAVRASCKARKRSADLWELPACVQGQLIPGPGLDALGQQQAAALAARLAREQFECVYTSDSQRAAQTAEAIGGATGHVPVAMPQL